MTKKLVVETECQNCPAHGNCAIEFVGGEGKLLPSHEMDMITGAVEIGLMGINLHWDNHAKDRDRLAEIIVEKGGDYSLCESPEGVSYYVFAMRQVIRMQKIIDMVTPFINRAEKRAEEAFAASKAVKN